MKLQSEPRPLGSAWNCGKRSLTVAALSGVLATSGFVRLADTYVCGMIVCWENLRMKPLGLSCCLCCLASALAAQTPPRPRYEVKRASSAIQIDGKLDEKAWQAADPIVLIFPWES